MIFIDSTTKRFDEANTYRLQIPITDTLKFNRYNFILLNLQSKVQYEINELINQSNFDGYFEFEIDLDTTNILDGTYYYQVFGLYDEHIDKQPYLCTTGLCTKRVDFNTNTTIKTYIEEKVTDIVYQG